MAKAKEKERLLTKFLVQYDRLIYPGKGFEELLKYLPKNYSTQLFNKVMKELKNREVEIRDGKNTLKNFQLSFGQKLIEKLEFENENLKQNPIVDNQQNDLVNNNNSNDSFNYDSQNTTKINNNDNQNDVQNNSSIPNPIINNPSPPNPSNNNLSNPPIISQIPSLTVDELNELIKTGVEFQLKKEKELLMKKLKDEDIEEMKRKKKD